MDLAPGEFVHGEAPLSGSDQTRLSSHPNDEQVVAEGSTISPHFHESISENDMSKEKANQAPVDIQLDTGSDPEAAVPKDDKVCTIPGVCWKSKHNYVAFLMRRLP